MTILNEQEISDWTQEACKSPTSDLILISPYISSSGLGALTQALQNRNRKLDVRLVTDIRGDSVVDGYLDLKVLIKLLKFNEQKTKNIQIHHISGLHAKVVWRRTKSGGKKGLISSSNLTSPRSIELGYEVKNQEAEVLRGKIDWMIQADNSVDIDYLEGVDSFYHNNKKLFRSPGGQEATLFEIFPGDGTYLDELKKLLNFCETYKSLKDVTKALFNERMRTDSTTPEQRLFFLIYLGLVKFNNGRIRRNPIGNKICKKQRKGKYLLWRLLFKKSLVFKQVCMTIASRSNDGSREFTYQKLHQWLSSEAPDRVEVSTFEEQQKRAVRWLRSLECLQDKRKEGHSNTLFFTPTARFKSFVASRL